MQSFFVGNFRSLVPNLKPTHEVDTFGGCALRTRHFSIGVSVQKSIKSQLKIRFQVEAI